MCKKGFGINSKILARALRDGIYIKSDFLIRGEPEDGVVIFVYNPALSYYVGGYYFEVDQENALGSFLLKDYKKTWALRAEDLQ